MSRTRDPGDSSPQSGRSSTSRAPECDERGHGGYRHGRDEDDEDEPNRDSASLGGTARYRDDEAIDLDPDTDLDIMEVLDIDDLKQMEGPDA